jgi:hypothetical protein
MKFRRRKKTKENNGGQTNVSDDLGPEKHIKLVS